MGVVGHYERSEKSRLKLRVSSIGLVHSKPQLALSQTVRRRLCRPCRRGHPNGEVLSFAPCHRATRRAPFFSYGRRPDELHRRTTGRPGRLGIRLLQIMLRCGMDFSAAATTSRFSPLFRPHVTGTSLTLAAFYGRRTSCCDPRLDREPEK